MGVFVGEKWFENRSVDELGSRVGLRGSVMEEVEKTNMKMRGKATV